MKILIDDYGNGWYKCHYTEKYHICDEITKIGSFIHGCGWEGYMAKSFTALHKESRILFDKMEQNCNTCKYLKRIKHEKRLHAPLQGICMKESPFVEKTIKFWPEDPMHMSCYVHRND